MSVNNIVVTADEDDPAVLKAMLASPPPEIVARMDVHGVIPPRMQARIGTWSRVATFSAGFVLLATVAFADGGYFRETWLWISLALSTLTWIVLVVRDGIAVGRLEVAGLAALASLAVWVALSAAWSPTPEVTIDEAERALIYVAGFLAVVLVVDGERLREYFAGIAAATILVVAYSFGERLLHPTPMSDPTQGTLLIEPFGYANALGIFATLGLLLSLGLTVSASTNTERIAWFAPAPILASALISTESRGAWFALIVGLVVVAAFRWDRIASLPPMVPKPAVLAALTGILALGVATAVVRADRPLGQRVDYWSVALHQWQENIWLGSGAGTFALYWLREDGSSAVLDAHSLYLETLAEVGPVGLLLLVGALSVPLFAAVRARHHPLTAVGAGAYTAYLVHTGLDWDWEMPAVTLAGLLCGIGILAASRQKDEFTVGIRGRRAIAVVALLLAGLAVAGGVTH